MEKALSLSFNMSASSENERLHSEVKLDTTINSFKEDKNFDIELLKAFGLIRKSSSKSILTFHCIYNSDGTTRWLWSANASQPNFIHFYNQGNFKSKLFVLAAKFSFKLGLGRFFKQGIIQVADFEYCDPSNRIWAVFTGTVGPNRKAILRTIDENGNVVFDKFPFTEIAKQNLGNENKALSNLKASSAERFFDYPFSINKNNSSNFSQTSLKGESAKSVPLVSQLDVSSFVEWVSSGLNNTSPTIETFSLNPKKFNPEFIVDFTKLQSFCLSNPLFHSAPVHGDFTPWNCRMLGKRLQILDWEMYQEQGIPLEDLFHYVYQQAILVERISFAQIRSRIQEMLAIPTVDSFLKSNQIHPALIEMHYLNRVCSYYLNVYSNQEKWHTQVNWLLETWAQSIQYLLAVQNEEVRKSVLIDFQKEISSFEYALLKFNLPDLSYTPINSDIDLCTTRADAQKMIDFFKQHSWVKHVVIKNLIKMLQVEVILLDGSRIDLDFIFQFKRNHIEYLDASKVLKNRIISHNGISNASPESNREYVLLFYTLNGALIPQKHLIWTHNQPDKIEQKKLIQSVLNRPENSGFSKIKNRIRYWTEILQNMRSEKGFLITFSGVDGAGKSTIIDAVKTELEKKHRRRVIVIRHRPSILPIISALKYGKKGAEERSVSTLPRQGQNSSKISSLIRFAYYLCDYIFGQWFIYFRYVRKNTIVLYDRYYFDFINDSRRSNIALNPKFTEKFYPFIKKPEFNYFLWAAPDVILKRKQELDKETIISLTKQYTELFARLQKGDHTHLYRCIENVEIGETVESIMRNVVGNTSNETPIHSTHSSTKS